MPKARAKCDPELTERFQAWWESRVTDHGKLGVSFARSELPRAYGLRTRPAHLLPGLRHHQARRRATRL